LDEIRFLITNRSQGVALPEYLTQRHGVWQFVHRVPQEFAHLDPRGVIKHSTHIEVIKDRRGTKAGKIADEMKRELEAYWKGLAEGNDKDATLRYEASRRRARTYGFDYVETPDLAQRATLERVERLEKILEAGLAAGHLKLTDVEAALPGGLPRYETRAALLGFEKRPTVKLSEVFSKFESQSRNEVKDMSQNQLKRWKNGYALAVADLIKVVGDKDLTTVTHTDILDYTEWLEDRVSDGEIVAKTANKYIGHNSRMFKDINRRMRLGLTDLFGGMRLKDR
jgi:hypothetical protein